MHYVWFWTFWHWSKESHRSGALLRDPLLGIASHWDEWFRHEATERDRREIAAVGRSEVAQRRFLRWLVCRWAREAGGGRNRSIPRFVLRQLAPMPPFCQWSVLEKYRQGYQVGGISAVVLAEASRGQPEDVRALEAVVVPADAAAGAPALVIEGFQAEPAELEVSRAAVGSLLGGKGLMTLLLGWTVSGRRPYSRSVAAVLTAGWLVVAALIGWLAVGPDPGARLLPIMAALLVLWFSLSAAGLGMVAIVSYDAWRAGRKWRGRLERSQVRLRMDGGLTLQGASAGLAFCLNTLLGVYHAHPYLSGRSWLWRVLFNRMRSDRHRWAATGVITAEARVKPVVLEPKLRASFEHTGIDRLLSPHQPAAASSTVRQLAEQVPPPDPARAEPMLRGRWRLGFAAEPPRLTVHPCRSAAQALTIVGGLRSRWQLAGNVLAVALSGVMALALPDIADVLLPPAPPVVVGPASPSPYYVWVNLDTTNADAFQVVLRSSFWANRRTLVERYSGANASVRAEIPLRRLSRQVTRDQEDGAIVIERRRQFLGREFLPGERVGSYSMAYLNHLPNE